MVEESLQHSEDAKFRRESKWLAFKGSLYSALSTATFFGVLGKLVMTAVDAFSGNPDIAAKAISSIGSPLSLGVMAGALAIGAVFTYMAQNEWTELKCIQDEHLAQRNAECNALEKAKAKALEQTCAIEHPQNQRADNKQWTQVVSEPAVAGRAAAIG